MVGSLAIAITFVATFPAAKLVDYFGLRAVTFLGGLICILSLVLTSFAKSIIVLFFTYSMGFGIGASFLYTTSMFMSSKYFKRRRNIALGVVCAGGGSGYLAFGPLLQLSIDKYGWKRSCLLMGSLFTLPLLIAFLYGSDSKRRSRENDEDDSNSNPKKTSSKVFDVSILNNSLYTISVASITLACLAHYVPQIYVVELCEKRGISSSKSSLLLIFIGLATLISRLFAGILQNSPNVSTLFVFQSSLILDAMVHLSIPFAYKYEHFIAVAILYGLADGGFSTSLNDLLLTTVRADQISSGFGFGCLVNSISVAAGAPLAGLLIKHFHSHSPAFFAGAGILAVSSILPCIRYCFVSISLRRKSRLNRNAEATIELCPNHLHKEYTRPKIIVAQACEFSPVQFTVCKETVENQFLKMVI